MKPTRPCTEVTQPSAYLYSLIATDCPCCTTMRALIIGFIVGALVGWAGGTFWAMVIVVLTVAVIFFLAEVLPHHATEIKDDHD